CRETGGPALPTLLVTKSSTLEVAMSNDAPASGLKPAPSQQAVPSQGTRPQPERLGGYGLLCWAVAMGLVGFGSHAFSKWIYPTPEPKLSPEQMEKVFGKDYLKRHQESQERLQKELWDRKVKEYEERQQEQRRQTIP